MKLNQKYVNHRNQHFTPHAIEAEDFVGTIEDERGERRHIVPRDEAPSWQHAVAWSEELGRGLTTKEAEIVRESIDQKFTDAYAGVPNPWKGQAQYKPSLGEQLAGDAQAFAKEQAAVANAVQEATENKGERKVHKKK